MERFDLFLRLVDAAGRKISGRNREEMLELLRGVAGAGESQLSVARVVAWGWRGGPGGPPFCRVKHFVLDLAGGQLLKWQAAEPCAPQAGTAGWALPLEAEDYEKRWPQEHGRRGWCALGSLGIAPGSAPGGDAA